MSATISKESLRNRLAKIREQSTEAVGQILQTAEIAGAAGGFSWANARYGTQDPKTGDIAKTLMGMPIDLGSAVVLHGLSFAGMLGRHKEHGHNLGDGALASYVCRVGTRMGFTSKNKANIAASQAQVPAHG